MKNTKRFRKDKSNIPNMVKSEKISVLDNTFKQTFVISILLITNFALIVSKINEFDSSLDANIVILFLMLIFIFVVSIYNMISWKITNILYNEDKIVIYKSLVNIDLIEFNIKNITGFVIEQNVLGKIFDFVRIKIYTNQLTKKKEDFQVVLKSKKANELKNYILNNLVDSKDITNSNYNLKNSSIKIKPSSILIHSLLSISIGNIIIIANVFSIIFTMITKGTFINEVFFNFIGFIVTIFSITFPALYSICSNFIKYSNYKVR